MQGADGGQAQRGRGAGTGAGVPRDADRIRRAVFEGVQHTTSPISFRSSDDDDDGVRGARAKELGTD